MLTVLTAALVAAVLFFATGPARPRTIPPRPPKPIVRGAVHVHTTRSDGALPKHAVAAAAARAGLQFVIFSDHGVGDREPDPPEYIDGVLCVDGVEVSANGGHYVAIGMKRAPYPLGGDADAVAEDVRRLGGFGIAAHPASPKEALRWQDWSVPVDGVEWLNADSEWRDETRLRLARGLLDYLWRPVGALTALFDRPASLDQWDALTATRRVVAVAGHDAHGGIGAEEEQGRRIHLPSYEASFRTFSTYINLPSPPTGDAATDAAAVVRGLHDGAVFTAIDGMATPASLDFSGVLGGASAGMGGALPDGDGEAVFSAEAAVPAGARILLKRAGSVVSERDGGSLRHTTRERGPYRIEVLLDGAPGAPPVPWLVSNPIYWPAPVERAPDPLASKPVAGVSGGWRVESDPGSEGRVRGRDGGAVEFSFRLKGGGRSSQFAALVTDLQAIPPEANAMALRVRSAAPMRVSVQVRWRATPDERWGRSAYLDGEQRTLTIPVDDLRPMGAQGSTGARPPLGQATSLLLVVDLTNAAPGAAGSFTVSAASLAHAVPGAR